MCGIYIYECESACIGIYVCVHPTWSSFLPSYLQLIASLGPQFWGVLGTSIKASMSLACMLYALCMFTACAKLIDICVVYCVWVWSLN